MLAEDVHQHVEPPAMGHADDRLAYAPASSVLHDFIKKRDEILSAFERESFLADVLAVQVVLELAGRGDPAQDVALLRRVEARPSPASLELFLHPPFLLGRGEVGHLGADRSAVRVAHQIVDLAKRRLRRADMEGSRIEHAIEVVLVESVVLGIEIGDRWPLVDPDGVEIRAPVAAVPIRVDERQHLHLLLRELGYLLRRDLGGVAPPPPGTWRRSRRRCRRRMRPTAGRPTSDPDGRRDRARRGTRRSRSGAGTNPSFDPRLG